MAAIGVSSPTALKQRGRKIHFIQLYMNMHLFLTYSIQLTQFRVESTTELCLLDGAEGGIGNPLGKKLNICPWYMKPVTYFLGKTACETPSPMTVVLPGLVAKLEPATRKEPFEDEEKTKALIFGDL
ncbi:hypothetical protein F3Y22_tig00116995pilonHSYRG00176 [Hibiscus syriacus]|uniref:Uncharacterized protein n=1 Tax=Hibiscus syriacus TaxID=106335 RepID=A0A6A2WNY4_HIBSY|nr:hypothetical protein F3Y22_tig00116995pilonHSYRG00176 [Hibiscus syriacus]